MTIDAVVMRMRAQSSLAWYSPLIIQGHSSIVSDCLFWSGWQWIQSLSREQWVWEGNTLYSWMGHQYLTGDDAFTHSFTSWGSLLLHTQSICMFFGRKPDKSEGTHTDTEKLHTESNQDQDRTGDPRAVRQQRWYHSLITMPEIPKEGWVSILSMHVALNAATLFSTFLQITPYESSELKLSRHPIGIFKTSAKDVKYLFPQMTVF